jgi:hypothetical protein
VLWCSTGSVERLGSLAIHGMRRRKLYPPIASSAAFASFRQPQQKPLILPAYYSIFRYFVSQSFAGARALGGVFGNDRAGLARVVDMSADAVQHHRDASGHHKKAAEHPRAGCRCLLIAGGIDLRPLPLQQRKAVLARIGERAESWVALTNGIIGDGRRFIGPWSMPDLEGIVAKPLADAYHPRLARLARWHKVLPQH